MVWYVTLNDTLGGYKMAKFTRRQRAMTPEQRAYKDRAYLSAFRNGFDKNYCSSAVKRYTPEEIAQYESKIMSAKS